MGKLLQNLPWLALGAEVFGKKRNLSPLDFKRSFKLNTTAVQYTWNRLKALLQSEKVRIPPSEFLWCLHFLNSTAEVSEMARTLNTTRKTLLKKVTAAVEALDSALPPVCCLGNS